MEVLRRIKLLRKLGLPLEEIRQMQHGAYTVGDGMRRHLVSLERERQNLEAAIRFCGPLTDRRERLEELGYIASYWGDSGAGARRRYYTITSAGREACHRLLGEWQETKEIMDKLLEVEEKL